MGFDVVVVRGVTKHYGSALVLLIHQIISASFTIVPLWAHTIRYLYRELYQHDRLVWCIGTLLLLLLFDALNFKQYVHQGNDRSGGYVPDRVETPNANAKWTPT